MFISSLPTLLVCGAGRVVNSVANVFHEKQLAAVAVNNAGESLRELEP